MFTVAYVVLRMFVGKIKALTNNVSACYFPCLKGVRNDFTSKPYEADAQQQ